MNQPSTNSLFGAADSNAQPVGAAGGKTGGGPKANNFTVADDDDDWDNDDL